MTSPPPPVPEVDVEAVVRRTFGDRNETKIEASGEGLWLMLELAVQAGLDARDGEVDERGARVTELILQKNDLKAEVERLKRSLVIMDDAFHRELATAEQLRARVGELEGMGKMREAEARRGEKALYARIASLEAQLAASEARFPPASMGCCLELERLQAKLSLLPEIEAALEAADTLLSRATHHPECAERRRKEARRQSASEPHLSCCCGLDFVIVKVRSALSSLRSKRQGEGT